MCRQVEAAHKSTIASNLGFKSMKRAFSTAAGAVAALGFAASALASASASIGASVSIAQSAGISIVTPLLLPTVSTTAVAPPSSFGGNTVVASGAPASAGGSAAANGAGAGASPLGNATLTIYGQSGSAVSMAVPETFKVIRTGGTESLTVKTNTNSPYSLDGNGVVLGGDPGSASMSVNVGGSLSMASADQLIAGPYEGLLVVVVQYN
ncbi:MAG: hypothetical protein JWP73_2296 [Phenylobacterium sp.]|nr:hypothetical protein [Phenylobacterium sp.]